MAWNPSPQVAAARDYGTKFGCKQVIVYFVQDDGRVGYASWGKTRELCASAKVIADNVFDMVEYEVEYNG